MGLNGTKIEGHWMIEREEGEREEDTQKEKGREGEREKKPRSERC